MSDEIGHPFPNWSGYVPCVGQRVRMIGGYPKGIEGIVTKVVEMVDPARGGRETGGRLLVNSGGRPSKFQVYFEVEIRDEDNRVTNKEFNRPAHVLEVTDDDQGETA